MSRLHKYRKYTTTNIVGVFSSHKMQNTKANYFVMMECNNKIKVVLVSSKIHNLLPSRGPLEALSA